MLWENLRAEEFESAIEQSKGVCALTVGCIEKHGQHLPLGVDTISSGRLVELAAEKEPVCVFPKMYFGEKQGAGEFKGTVIFSSKLIFDILTETCSEIARNGFKKIILVSGHGGNESMLKNFCRSVLYKKNNYLVYYYYASSAWGKPKVIIDMIDKNGRQACPELTDEDIGVLRAYVEEGKKGGHGCFAETSIMYGLYPELVRLDRMNAEDGTSKHVMDHLTKEGFYTPFAWMADYPNSLSAEYHAGLNERIAKTAVRIAVDNMAHAFKVLKEDTASVEYHAQWLKKQP